MTIFYIRNNELHFKEENKKLFILKKDKKTAIELVGVALTIWNLLESKKTIDEIVEGILKEYSGSTRIEVQTDVHDFIEKCIKNSIVKKLKK